MGRIESAKIWLRKNLFINKWYTFVSIILIFLLLKIFWSLSQWLIFNSVWDGSPNDCREASGACLAFVKAKFWYILLGVYPHEEIHRPVIAMGVYFCFLYAFTRESISLRKKAIAGMLVFCLCYWLLAGGLGLKIVPTHLWGGLPLTLALATFGVLFGYPLGILLALGRRSKLVIIKSFCIFYIEMIRGVPLISLLFMASVMFPIFLPEGAGLDKVLRAQLAFIIFTSAYLAEVVRGGLQGVSNGQYEAARALGLNYYQMMRYVVLPQALKKVIPPTVNTIIGMFKDTSLVIIIALMDMMATAKSSLADSNWLGFSIEVYCFVATIYFIFCFCMSRYGKAMERRTLVHE